MLCSPPAPAGSTTNPAPSCRWYHLAVGSPAARVSSMGTIRRHGRSREQPARAGPLQLFHSGFVLRFGCQQQGDTVHGHPLLPLPSWAKQYKKLKGQKKTSLCTVNQSLSIKDRIFWYFRPVTLAVAGTSNGMTFCHT